MLIYPPGKLYQRGEDRSQGNVEDSTATSIRACNDLGYAASSLLRKGYKVFLKDYQTENLTKDKLLADFRNFSPDVIWLSITNATIFHDLEIVKELKQIRLDIVVILKGALFFAPKKTLLDQLDLSNITYLLGGESDFIAAKLIDTHFNNITEIANIRGILYRRNNQWCPTDFKTFETDLDNLPFPARQLMTNKLYARPDTGAPQATIATSRGCSSNCIYCLTPKISGQKVRLRSTDDILSELQECFSKHQIKNFFFKSDTFTIKKEWTRELCEKIINSNLQGKIQWVANSRTRPLDRDTLQIMKDAGCWLVAFGFESGSSESLRKIKKGATVDDNLKAAKLAKEVGLKIFGFYLIGFPWENETHLQQTKKMIYDIDADFMELHLAIPYYGTPLYKLAEQEGLITASILGRDYFNPPSVGTKFLSFDELIEFRKNLLFRYHFRPSFIFKKLAEATTQPAMLKNYLKFGIKLLRHSI